MIVEVSVSALFSSSASLRLLLELFSLPCLSEFCSSEDLFWVLLLGFPTPSLLKSFKVGFFLFLLIPFLAALVTDPMTFWVPLLIVPIPPPKVLMASNDVNIP